MSMYVCGHCQEWRDDGYSGGYEHPGDDKKIVCEDCHFSLEAEKQKGDMPERDQADVMAKRLADKYGKSPGQWCKIYHVAWLSILNKEPFSQWKTYIKILAST